MTKKEIMNKLKGKQVIIHYDGIMTTADNEPLKKSIIDALADNGKTIEDFVEDETTYSVNGFTNFWRKSKLIQDEKAIFNFNTVDILTTFENGDTRHGEVPKVKDMVIFENGFTKFMNDEHTKSFTYTLAE